MMEWVPVWIEARPAAQMLSERSNHKIGVDYVRKLAQYGKIRYRSKDGRTNEYYRDDIVNYTVRKNKERKKSKGSLPQ